MDALDRFAKEETARQAARAGATTAPIDVTLESLQDEQPAEDVEAKALREVLNLHARIGDLGLSVKTMAETISRLRAPSRRTKVVEETLLSIARSVANQSSPLSIEDRVTVIWHGLQKAWDMGAKR